MMHLLISPRVRRTLGTIAILCLALVGACTAPPSTHDAVLTTRLNSVLHRLDDSGATFTARVVELPSRRELYAVDVDEPVIPASNLKVPVSAAALDLFGADHTFKTYLAFDGENLWIVGTGDPGIGDPRIAEHHGETCTSVLTRWAQALEEAGLRQIRGNLYYYDAAFEAAQIHPSWKQGDLVHWYAAPVSGLNFNDNCVDITIRPTRDGEPAAFEVEPPVANIDVINECVSGAGEEPTISKRPGVDLYVLKGGCEERTKLKSKPVGNPGAFFADALRTCLASRGIIIEGDIRRAHQLFEGPPQWTEALIAEHKTRMRDVMWRINKNSQNLFAECTCKLAGQAYELRQGNSVPGSWTSGDKAVRAFLRKYDIDDRQLVLADGSGLSRDNRVTARMITDIFTVMFGHPDRETFRASLSVAGKDGTLHKRLKDVSGHVFAKTGYISGVRALSGYVRTRGGRWLCFSFIYNNIPGSVAPYEELQDEACRILQQWPSLESDDHAALPHVTAMPAVEYVEQRL